MPKKGIVTGGPHHPTGRPGREFVELNDRRVVSYLNSSTIRDLIFDMLVGFAKDNGVSCYDEAEERMRSEFVFEAAEIISQMIDALDMEEED